LPEFHPQEAKICANVIDNVGGDLQHVKGVQSAEQLAYKAGAILNTVVGPGGDLATDK